MLAILTFFFSFFPPFLSGSYKDHDMSKWLFICRDESLFRDIWQRLDVTLRFNCGLYSVLTLIDDDEIVVLNSVLEKKAGSNTGLGVFNLADAKQRPYECKVPPGYFTPMLNSSKTQSSRLCENAFLM